MSSSDRFLATFTLDHVKALIDGDHGIFGWLGYEHSDALSKALVDNKAESVTIAIEEIVAKCLVRSSADAVRMLHPASPLRAAFAEQIKALDEWLDTPIVERLAHA